MEKKSVLLPAALGLAAAAFYLVALSSKEKALSGQYETARVLVARVDIPERAALKPEMVEAVEMPRRFVAQDAIEYRVPSDLRLVANLVARVRVPKGSQLAQSALMPLSPESGLAVKVPPGYRGAVLGVEPELRRLIKPGDRVDVAVTFDAQMNDGRREKVTATILQNILVIGVGRDLGQGMSAGQHKAAAESEARESAFAEKATLSLALDPRQFQYLALASRQGETAVALRGHGDHELHPIEMSALSRLFR